MITIKMTPAEQAAWREVAAGPGYDKDLKAAQAWCDDADTLLNVRYRVGVSSGDLLMFNIDTHAITPTPIEKNEERIDWMDWCIIDLEFSAEPPENDPEFNAAALSLAAKIKMEMADASQSIVSAKSKKPKKKNPAAVALGRLGGLARAKSTTPERRSEIARLGNAIRWGKK